VVSRDDALYLSHVLFGLGNNVVVNHHLSLSRMDGPAISHRSPLVRD
jgi:hypothetical protein